MQKHCHYFNNYDSRQKDHWELKVGLELYYEEMLKQTIYQQLGITPLTNRSNEVGELFEL